MGFCGVIQKRSFQSGKKKNAVIRLVRLSTMYRPELNWRDQYRIMMYSIFKILFFLSLSLKRFRNNCPSSNMLSTHCQSKTCPPSPGRPAFRFSVDHSLGSFANLCLTFGNLMSCSTQGFPVLHHFRQLAQTLAH